MKKIWGKIKRPVCVVIMLICLFLLLGCTGAADFGGDINSYCFQGSVLLGTAIAAGIIGGIIE